MNKTRVDGWWVESTEEEIRCPTGAEVYVVLKKSREYELLTEVYAVGSEESQVRLLVDTKNEFDSEYFYSYWTQKVQAIF